MEIEVRDLTEGELKLAPHGCDHYNVIDDKVYFTDVLGIYVCDIDGVEIDNRIMDSMVFAKSVPLPKEPFDITKHEFSDAAKDCRIMFNSPSWVGDDLQIEIQDVDGGCVDGILIKDHAIAIAKHFKLTTEDLK